MTDIDMTSAIMQHNSSNYQASFEYLYPHGFDCESILVPALRRKEHFLFKIFHYNTLLCLMILMTFVTFVICRIFIESTSPSEWFSEFILTLGYFFAQHFIISPKSKREYSWIFCMLIFTQTSLALLSSILYQSIVVSRYEPEIDTLEQLASSDLNIVLVMGQTEWRNGRYTSIQY